MIDLLNAQQLLLIILAVYVPSILNKHFTFSKIYKIWKWCKYFNPSETVSERDQQQNAFRN